MRGRAGARLHSIEDRGHGEGASLAAVSRRKPCLTRRCSRPAVSTPRRCPTADLRGRHWIPNEQRRAARRAARSGPRKSSLRRPANLEVPSGSIRQSDVAHASVWTPCTMSCSRTGSPTARDAPSAARVRRASRFGKCPLIESAACCSPWRAQASAMAAGPRRAPPDLEQLAPPSTLALTPSNNTIFRDTRAYSCSTDTLPTVSLNPKMRLARELERRANARRRASGGTRARERSSASRCRRHREQRGGGVDHHLALGRVAAVAAERRRRFWTATRAPGGPRARARVGEKKPRVLQPISPPDVAADVFTCASAASRCRVRRAGLGRRRRRHRQDHFSWCLDAPGFSPSKLGLDRLDTQAWGADARQWRTRIGHRRRRRRSACSSSATSRRCSAACSTT